ncbi:site-specific integrase [Lutibacter flavus]|uniref:Site-specific recombinase XerD n=1 Tax=Lutibacter flavus TaxID=691689 RepID=A0A238XJC5_9FLAO|nr:site-specific integrase [Lutibacter flavus]SNR58681.1 Site-specific recombinase XerD [Lutibacter flavus]
MIKTFFYLKTDKQNNEGESPIYAKISLQGKTTTLSTRKFISKERWMSTNKLRNTLRIITEKNSKTALDLIETKIESIYYELSKNNLGTTLLDVKHKLNNKDSQTEENDILNIFQKHNKDFEKKVKVGEKSKASLQKYNRAKDLLSKYIKSKYRKNSFSVKDIDNQFVLNLENYLKYESTYKNKVGISHNSVVKYFQCFKTASIYGIKYNLCTTNPFLLYDKKLKIERATFLTKDELERIEAKVFTTERLEKVKDIFLFSCYTGYAPVDVEKLTKKNLIKDNDGSDWINTNRAKTNIESDVPLIPPAKGIIDKYSNIEGDKLLPIISNQKINEYLKEIADLCRIDKNLTHYVARHTFATTIALGNGVAIENVSSMMGHTNIKMTQHYAKVLDKNVKKDMEKVSEKYS